MKGCINSCKYNKQIGKEINICPGGQIMINGIGRHTVSINVQMNGVECTMLHMKK
jgi:hypothetical protein